MADLTPITREEKIIAGGMLSPLREKKKYWQEWISSPLLEEKSFLRLLAAVRVQ